MCVCTHTPARIKPQECSSLINQHSMTTSNGIHDSVEGRKEMFYLTTHSTHFIYGYMASDIMVNDHSDSERGNSFRLAARVILYASSHRQDNTYHGLCYTSRGVLARTRNSSVIMSNAVSKLGAPQHSTRTRCNLVNKDYNLYRVSGYSVFY